MSNAGHNSGTDSGGIAGDHLKSYIERIERVQKEIDALNSDKSEIYAEAKGTGFDTKVMKQLIKERRMEPHDRVEQEELLDIYRRAIGMIDATHVPARETAATKPRPSELANKAPARSPAELAEAVSKLPKHEQTLVKAVVEAQAAGVDVTVITDDDPLGTGA